MRRSRVHHTDWQRCVRMADSCEHAAPRSSPWLSLAGICRDRRLNKARVPARFARSRLRRGRKHKCGLSLRRRKGGATCRIGAGGSCKPSRSYSLSRYGLNRLVEKGDRNDTHRIGDHRPCRVRVCCESRASRWQYNGLIRSGWPGGCGEVG